MAFPRLRNRSAFALIFGVAILEFQRNVSVKLELSASADEVTVKLVGRIDCQWVPMGEIDGHSAIEVGPRVPAGAIHQNPWRHQEAKPAADVPHVVQFYV